MILPAALALGACLAVGANSDQVLAGDLAVAAREWSAIPPETPLALSPAPGVQRVFRLPELQRLAQRWKLTSLPERDICITRPVTQLDPALLLASMRRQLPGASIEILDFSRQLVPQGELEFPLSNLRQSAAGAWWAGFVRYAGQRRFAVWARVKVMVKVSRVIATGPIAAGKPIDAALLRLEPREEFPSAGFVANMDEASGKSARRSIAAGSVLRTEWLEPAKAVNRGDAVEVEIISGSAHLTLDGIAASSGAIGDMILVLNPDSKRQFRARILSAGKVLVTRGNS